MATRMAPEERETHIAYTQSPGEQAEISTADTKLIHHLRKLGVEPERVETEYGQVVSAEFRVPKEWVKVSPPRKVAESQRESARKVMQTLNERRQQTMAKRRARRSARKDA